MKAVIDSVVSFLSIGDRMEKTFAVFNKKAERQNIYFDLSLINCSFLGMYETVTRIVLKLEGLLPEKWSIFLFESLLEAFPEEKKQLDEMWQSYKNRPAEKSNAISENSINSIIPILKTIPPFSNIKEDLTEYIMSPDRDNFIAFIEKDCIQLWSVQNLRSPQKDSQVTSILLRKNCSVSIKGKDGNEKIIFEFLKIAFRMIKQEKNRTPSEKCLMELRNFVPKNKTGPSQSQLFESAKKLLNGKIGMLRGEQNKTAGRDNAEYGRLLIEGSLQTKELVFHINPKDIFVK